MKRIRVNGRELAYVDVGQGPETVLLSHCYLLDHRHYASQIEALATRFRVLAYDHRDHGQSDLATSAYSVEDLYADCVAFIEALDIAKCHFVGLSSGGYVGMRLGIRRPDLLSRLVLMGTTARADRRIDKVANEVMFVVLRALGFDALSKKVLPLIFGRTFLDDPSRSEEIDRWVAHLKSRDRGGIIRFGRAISRREPVLSMLGSIELPTLVVVGEEDVTTPPPRAKEIAERIPGAELAVIPRAGHLSTLENPELVNETLLRFLS